MSWGLHSIHNLYRCNPFLIRCPTNISNFASHLVKEIDMIPFGKPQVVFFGKDNKAGYTLVQLIETSNITGHFVEEDNSAFIDVFSCKEFDPKDVEKVLQLFFQPTHIDTRVFERRAKDKHELK